MPWIKTISLTEATGQLRQLYDRLRRSDGDVDNILKLHSLRPHTLEGHMTLYKYVLHHSANTTPKWLLEAVGVFVSQLNGCAYCVQHHAHGMARLLNDPVRAAAVRAALERLRPEDVFDGAELAAMEYARLVTQAPSAVGEADVVRLRAAGFDDGQILEINQVVSYFAYANRTVLGLGATTEGEPLGHSPNNSADPQDWSHTDPSER